MTSLLKGSNLKGGYELESGIYVDAVSNVSLELHKNEILGIAGESGCGKSTLIRILYGYVEPPLTLKNGSIELYAKDGSVYNIPSLSINNLRNKVWWKHISYIPQNAMNVLNPSMRIRDHFAEIYREHLGLEKREAYSTARKYIESFGLPIDVLSAFPHQLSGGMKQRIVIALSLLLEPDLVLADEPTSALDVINQRASLTLLKDMQEKLGNTVVLVSHDMGVQSVLTDRIAVMYAGKIVEVGETQEILRNQLHPYTEALFSSLPRIGDKTQRKGLTGQPPDLKNPPSGCRFHPRCPYAKHICSKEEPKMMKDSDHQVACWLYAR